MTLEEKIDALSAQVTDFNAKVGSAGRQRVSFPTQRTGAGIELSGTTTVETTGYLLAVTMVQTGPGQLSPLFVVKVDGLDTPAISNVVRFID